MTLFKLLDPWASVFSSVKWGEYDLCDDVVIRIKWGRMYIELMTMSGTESN